MQFVGEDQKAENIFGPWEMSKNFFSFHTLANHNDIISDYCMNRNEGKRKAEQEQEGNLGSKKENRRAGG